MQKLVPLFATVSPFVSPWVTDAQFRWPDRTDSLTHMQPYLLGYFKSINILNMLCIFKICTIFTFVEKRIKINFKAVPSINHNCNLQGFSSYLMRASTSAVWGEGGSCHIVKLLASHRILVDHVKIHKTWSEEMRLNLNINHIRKNSDHQCSF